jgi:predicted MFS family arabinose efflux permease
MRNLIFVVMLMGMFTVGCNAFMIEGLLPQISLTIGKSIAVTGQGITSFSLAYFLSAPLLSLFFSNKSIKRNIQIALLIFLLGNLITLISKTLVLFIIGMSLAGVGIGFFTPLCVTIAMHFSDASAKGSALSLVWGANSAGVVFGVPFGIYLSSFFNWQLSIAYIIILGLFVFIGFSSQAIDIKLPILPSLKNQLRLLGNQKIMLVIGMACFVSMACLGLYAYIATIQPGTPHSLALILFSWGLGGFIGSSLVGIFIDSTKKPDVIMVVILMGLIITFITLPFIKNLPY